MPRFVLSREARADLRDVDDDIAADDPVAARRVLEDIRTAMHRLADHPGLGHLREDLEAIADHRVGPVRFQPSLAEAEDARPGLAAGVPRWRPKATRSCSASRPQPQPSPAA
ncbi:MAG: type II toxin-antitoxin system RelE/ParE family toxin [Nitriliruptoraceae bacterium]